ncbi:MAG: type IV pilus assembly protein PilM [bacterium]|nr:type IV pilus assembly protein PilM [bacterium]
MWPFSKPKAFLGVDIGAGGIKIVELRQQKSRPVLFTYGFTSEARNVHDLLDSATPLSPADIGYNEAKVQGTISDEHLFQYAEAITQICAQAKTVSKTAVVSLPVSAVFHALVTLPEMKKEDFNTSLRAEIKKLLPRPLEEMALDYQIVKSTNPEDKNQRVLVNAVPGELVQFYSKVFHQAGLTLDALEPESSALTRSLVGKDNAVTMLIDIGAERTNFFIIDNAVPVTNHSIEIGGNKINAILQAKLGVKDADAEQIKLDLSINNIGSMEAKNAFIKMLMPVIDPIEKEIEYSFGLYIRQSGNENRRPEKIVLTGGSALLPGIADYLSNKFQIKCFVGDPWARAVYQDGIRPLLQDIGPRMSVAIGLALRNMV